MTWKPDTLSREVYEAAKEHQVNLVSLRVAKEVKRAMALHPSMRNRHEAYAVILEELEEFWLEVKKKKPDPEKLYSEAIQTAAMCVRAIVDLEGFE